MQITNIINRELLSVYKAAKRDGNMNVTINPENTGIMVYWFAFWHGDKSYEFSNSYYYSLSGRGPDRDSDRLLLDGRTHAKTYLVDNYLRFIAKKGNTLPDGFMADRSVSRAKVTVNLPDEFGKENIHYSVPFDLPGIDYTNLKNMDLVHFARTPEIIQPQGSKKRKTVTISDYSKERPKRMRKARTIFNPAGEDYTIKEEHERSPIVTAEATTQNVSVTKTTRTSSVTTVECVIPIKLKIKLQFRNAKNPWERRFPDR